MNEHQLPTHGIVHAGFRGFRGFVACKKGRCKLIGNHFEHPHDTIPSNVSTNIQKNYTKNEINIINNRTTLAN
jgi:hypothetical protein